MRLSQSIIRYSQIEIIWSVAVVVILALIVFSTSTVAILNYSINRQSSPIRQSRSARVTNDNVLPNIADNPTSLGSNNGTTTNQTLNQPKQKQDEKSGSSTSNSISSSSDQSPTVLDKSSNGQLNQPSSGNGQSDNQSPSAPSSSPSAPSSNPTSNPTPTSGGQGLTNQLASCGDDYTFFDTSPVAVTDFDGLVPLGNVNPSGHTFPTDHIYFYFNTNTSRHLYSPGPLTVTQISASQNLTQGVSDYSINLQPCAEFTVYFLHVSSLSSTLAAAFNASTSFDWDSTYTTGGNTYRNYGRKTNLSVNAGDELGTVGGNPNQTSFDMGAYDTRVTLNFINQNARSNSLHTVCPIDYYSGSLKTTLMGRFGDYDGDPKRTTAPVCGSIDQDVAGSAQGVWLVKGTTKVSGEDLHLALIHNNIYPNRAVFSVGTSMSVSNLHVGYYEFNPQNSGLVNRDFDDIRADGNIYCYEIDGQGWVEGNITIWVQMPTPSTLKIERGSASTCGAGLWSFTSNASEFQR